MTPGLVSICIPTYNGAKYLQQCLQSAQAQTFTAVEILLVDDCSSDGTVDLARALTAGDPRVRVLCNDRNLGLVGNWNRCVELARGEWIKYLFQDDWLEPDCVERMVSAAARPLVFCRRDFAFEGTEPRLRQIYERHLGELSIEGVFGPGTTEVSAAQLHEAALHYLHTNIFGEPTACMMHRSVFSRFGLYDPRLVQLCDVEHAFRIGVNTGLSYVPARLAHFRVHGASTTQTNERRGSFRKKVVDQLLILHSQAVDPAYAPLRDTAARTGQDLAQRFADVRRAEQLWGQHWADAGWGDVVRQFPCLRLPLVLRTKRAARLVLHNLALLRGQARAVR